MKILSPRSVQSLIESDRPTHPVWSAVYSLPVGGGVEITPEDLSYEPGSVLYSMAKKWNKRYTIKKLHNSWLIIRKA